MNVANSIHFGLAYLVALCALVFSWNAMGRRVMNVVLGIQVLAGIALAGTFGAAHAALPKNVGFHMAGAIVALIAYGLAARAGKRPGGSRAALAYSIVGLLCVAVTIYLGTHMYFTGAA
jgi:hypothetical protein